MNTGKDPYPEPEVKLNRQQRRAQDKRNAKIAKLLTKGVDLVAKHRQAQIQGFRDVFIEAGLDVDGEHKELFEQALKAHLG